MYRIDMDNYELSKETYFFTSYTEGMQYIREARPINGRDPKRHSGKNYKISFPKTVTRTAFLHLLRLK